MLNLDINQPRLKILLIILAVILVVVLGFTCYSINKKMKLENQNVSAPAPKAQEGNKPLTAEEIQEALSKKADETDETAETGTEAISADEIQKALNKKSTDTQSATALTPEEIQSALNAKAN